MRRYFLYTCIILGNAVVSCSPSNKQVSYTKGVNFYEQGNYDSAIAYLAEARKQDSSNMDLNYYLGSAYLKKEQYGPALFHLGVSQELGKEDALTDYKIGLVYYQVGTPRLAFFKSALAKDPKMQKAWHYGGIIHYDQGNYDSAYFYHTKALALGEADHQSYFRRSLASYALKNFDEALKDIDTALDKEKKEPLYYVQKAMTLGPLERREEAIDYCNRALALNPDTSDALYLKALNHFNLYQDSLGCIAVKQLKTIDPERDIREFEKVCNE